MPRAEIGYEFRHSVSRVHALTNPSADTRRKARQRAGKKAQRLEKVIRMLMKKDKGLTKM